MHGRAWATTIVSLALAAHAAAAQAPVQPLQRHPDDPPILCERRNGVRVWSGPLK